MGSALMEENRHAEAMEYCQREYEMQKRQIRDLGGGMVNFDWNKPVEVALACSRYSNCLHKLGRIREAVRVMTEGLDYCTYRDPGTPNQEYQKYCEEVEALLMNNYAELLVHSGQIRQAASMREEALAKRKRLCGKDSKDWIEGAFALGCDYQKLGRLEEAQALFEESKERAERVMGPLSQHVFKCKMVLETFHNPEEIDYPNMARLTGLEGGHADLNGKMVEVKKYLAKRDRYKILVEIEGEEKAVCVKPSNLILSQGARVVINGLKSATHLNEKSAVVIGWDEGTSRYAVRLTGANQQVAVKPENITVR